MNLQNSDPRSPAILSRELFQAAKSGDREALGQLLFLYYDRLERVVLGQLEGVPHVRIHVEDILQDTFIRAFRGFAAFSETDPGSFGRWLDTLARNSLRDGIRVARRLKRRGGSQGLDRAPHADRDSWNQFKESLIISRESTPSQAVATTEAIRAVQVNVAQLSDEQRQAIRLRYLDQCSLAQAAEVMQRSPNAVRGLIYRAKQALKNAMGHSAKWFSRR